jgi:hypothetical protein
MASCIMALTPRTYLRSQSLPIAATRHILTPFFRVRVSGLNPQTTYYNSV